MDQFVYHIISHDDWKQAADAKEYAPVSLRTDGFIHCSTKIQTAKVANVFFKARQDLMLLQIDTQKLNSELKYDSVDDGTFKDLFPHIYGPLNRNAVVKELPFPPNAEGVFDLARMG